MKTTADDIGQSPEEYVNKAWSRFIPAIEIGYLIDPDLLADITLERVKMIQAGQTSEHDDKLCAFDWETHIRDHANRMTTSSDGSDENWHESAKYREHLVSVLAIGIAALEAYDRNNNIADPAARG